MLAKLSGKVIEIFSDFIILDVNGVGYRVETGFSGILEGENLDLYIYTKVSQDEIRLFGFKLREDFLLFSELLSVSGVGPKVALNLLQNVGKEKIIYAVEKGESAVLRSPGVGDKTAQRIIVDLKSRIKKIDVKIDQTLVEKSIDSKPDLRDEVAEALITLGYSKKEADIALGKIEFEQNVDDSETLIKKALKYLH